MDERKEAEKMKGWHLITAAAIIGASIVAAAVLYYEKGRYGVLKSSDGVVGMVDYNKGYRYLRSGVVLDIRGAVVMPQRPDYKPPIR